MSPTLYNVFNDSVTPKEKKPRTPAQIEAFTKAREALALKRKTPKDVKAPPAKKVEVEVIADDETPPSWFKKFIRDARERSVQKAPQKAKESLKPPSPIKAAAPPQTQTPVQAEPTPQETPKERNEETEVIRANNSIPTPKSGIVVPEKSSRLGADVQMQNRCEPPQPLARPQIPQKSEVRKSKLFPGRGF